MAAETKPTRFIGLDVHKFYLIAVGVNAERNQVLGPQRVRLQQLGDWIRKTLTPTDAVVLEMTTNTWQLYDDLKPYVHSVTVVHPPHLALITRAQVMNDKIAALTLARLHAAGLVPPIWIPPPAVRDTRALVAQRSKMVRLSTQAKNRLHAVLHRYHLDPPEGNLFAPEQRDWWLALQVTPSERTRIQSDLDTLQFARAQIKLLEHALARIAATDERVPLLIQLPGFSFRGAISLLAAIGDITRFVSAEKLVGYAGLGARVHDSGLTHRSGRMTKAGRRDIRTTVIEAAHAAARTHPHWKAVLARLEPRLGYNKAIGAIARKLLIAVWHVLTEHSVDRFAQPALVARKFYQHTNSLGKAQRLHGQTAADYVRAQLDQLGIGADLEAIPVGQSQAIALPPSRLAQTQTMP